MKHKQICSRARSGDSRSILTLRNKSLLLRIVSFCANMLATLILAINQLNAQNIFYNKFIIRLYMFRALSARALCAHH